jgi:hypothetical protein
MQEREYFRLYNSFMYKILIDLGTYDQARVGKGP